MFRPTSLRLVFLIAVLLSSICTGQQEAEEVRQRHLRDFLNESCKDFEITTNSKDATTKGEVVFRWDNRRRGSADGCTALWHDDQRRPIAIASVFPIRDTLHYDFDLTDRRIGAKGKFEGKEFWRTPRDSKLKFEPIAGAPKPSRNETARRAQMKLIARSYSVELLGWRNDPTDQEALRMLPTPVHRYGSSEEGSEVLEGGLFLFVQGVDPEAALLLEAYRHKDGYRWEYALVPQTSGALEATYKKKVVWKKGVNQVDPSHGYVSKPIPRN